MIKMTKTILAILLSAILFTACSSEEASITEKASNKINEINKKNADTLVKKIKSPIDKARLTQDLGDQRMEEMNRALENQ